MQACHALPVGTSQFVGETWRPVALLSLQVSSVRDRVRSALERAGWAVIEHPTGFHVVRALAALIEGQPVWNRPRLVVVDALSRGCTGISIAAGLRKLGVDIPLVIVTAEPALGRAHVALDPHGAHITDPDTAPQLVSALARRLRTGTTHTLPMATSPLARLESALIAHTRKEETTYEPSHLS